MFQRRNAKSLTFTGNVSPIFGAALAVLFVIASHEASALPHHDGVVSVGNHKFYVGELTDLFGDDARSFQFRHAPWFKAILDNDPLLFDQDVRFLRSGVPAPDLIGGVPTQKRERERLEYDPRYMAEGHDVVASGINYLYIS